MKCYYDPTGNTTEAGIEYRCYVCGHVRTSKYPADKLHRNCQPPGQPSEVIPSVVPPSKGPGTELKRLLSAIGITDGGCNCNAHAAEMDARGVEWCKANVATIVGWLREEAASRRLPFVEVAARWIIRRAIKNAETQQAASPSTH